MRLAVDVILSEWKSKNQLCMVLELIKLRTVLHKHSRYKQHGGKINKQKMGELLLWATLVSYNEMYEP